MILSFSEFNDLYESSNGLGEDEYSNGIEVMEALLTVMQEREVLSESEVVTFLDNVLDETGYDLNTEVYESYAEWIADWSQFIDEGINEDESELLFALTRRGQNLVNEGVKDSLAAAGGAIKKGAIAAGGAINKGVTNVGKSIQKKGINQQKGGNVKTGNMISSVGRAIKRNPKLALGAAAAGTAAAGYGAYKGIKALKARSAAKKAAAGQPAK